MGTMASQINSLAIVYSTVYSGADQRKHQSPASLALVRGIHRGPVNSPHKWPVTRIMFPFDDVIMIYVSLNLVVICSGNTFFSTVLRHAPTQNNSDPQSSGPFGTSSSKIWIKYPYWKMSSVKCRPFCLGPNMSTHYCLLTPYYLGQKLT